MTPAEIQKEWGSFIEYPERSNRMYVTTTSALLFARYIADMAADKEREAIIDTVAFHGGSVEIEAAIRARGFVPKKAQIFKLIKER